MQETKGELANRSGAEAEQDAKAYLLNQGLQFIEQNFSVPLGELDLVFKDKNQWVFVEVKYQYLKGELSSFFEGFEKLDMSGLKYNLGFSFFLF